MVKQVVRPFAIPAAALAMMLGGTGAAVAAVIPVTSLDQKTSGIGGCSLQEAIYSANYDNNVAVKAYVGSTPVWVPTQCVPGSGDDSIGTARRRGPPDEHHRGRCG